MDETSKRLEFGLSNRVRICGNHLVGEMRKNLEKLNNDQQYLLEKENLKILNQKINSDKLTKNEIKKLTEDRKDKLTILQSIRQNHNVTWDYTRKYMESLSKKFDVNSVFALTKAEDIWDGVEKILFSNGKELNFKKKGDLPILRAKQINRIIIPVICDNKICLKLNIKNESKIFQLKYNNKDIFLSEELEKIKEYLINGEKIEAEAIEMFKNTGIVTDVYRPCYVSLKCEIIRNKLRIFAHICVTGNASQKKKKDVNGELIPRHNFSKTGIIGADIGTHAGASHCSCCFR